MNNATAGQPQQQQQVYQPYSQPSTNNVHPLRQPQPVQTQRQPSPTKKQSSPIKQQQQRSKPSTPDEEVDAFLQGPSTQETAKQLLRPGPLPPNQTALQKSKTLASRRAWGDVIRVTNDALLGNDVGGGGAHVTFYDELTSSASAGTTTAAGTNNASLSEVVDSNVQTLRRETCEFIALRFISQLKLRRYVDLGKEVEKLDLMPYLPDKHFNEKGATNEDDGSGQQSSHVRMISGLPVVHHDGTMPDTPDTPGTMCTEASVDILSSSPVTSSLKQLTATLTQQDTTLPNLAWKEGSMHPPPATKDIVPAWVPFGLRILAAIQLQYNDGSSKSIDVLYDLRDRTVRTEYWNTGGMEIWRGTIDNALANAFVRKKEWRLALRSLEDLLNEKSLESGVLREVDHLCAQEGNDDGENDARQWMTEVITACARVELLSRQLLILLQSGAVTAAEMIQKEVRHYAAKVQSQWNNPFVSSDNNDSSMTTSLVGATKGLALVRQVPSRQLVNEGLLQFARCKYTEAATYFRDALKQQRELDTTASSSQQLSHLPTTTDCPTWKDLSSPTLGFSTASNLTFECLNNLSLCLLYSGNMRSAVQELESLIRQDPTLYLTESMAFNLCTLYELGSEGEECTRKKKLLNRIAKRFYLHDVGVESFRLG